MLYQDIKPWTTLSRKPFFRLALRYINDDSVVLEVGAGKGEFAEMLPNPEKAYLLDANENTVHLLANKYPNVVLASLPYLPFEEDFFDVIHCSHVVEHLEPVQLYDTLVAFDSCLKPNGYLIISAPLLSPIFYNDLSHVKPYEPFVFLKYLVWGKKENATRPIISEAYKVIQLQKRYYEVPLDELTYNIKYRILQSLHYRYVHWKHKIGFRKFKENGFTLILKKQVII